MKIPVNRPLLDGNEGRYLQECIDTGWISSEGPFVERFETEFSAKVGRKHGIAVSSGTAALDIAFELIDLQPGDEIIVPAFTIISCIHQIIRRGAIPVLVDSEADTWNMDTTIISSRITSRTRAILAVHIYGLPTNMTIIESLASKFNLFIIEDAAEAHGLTIDGKPCGSFGDVSIFSFYPNKLITTGEGGMLVTNNDSLARRSRSLRNLCFAQPRYVHESIGWNYRMTNLQAALGVAQLERWDEFIQRKRQIGKNYTNLLTDVNEIQIPIAHTNYAQNIYWVFGVVLRNEQTGEQVITLLDKMGVSTRSFFCPLHLQPVLINAGLFKGESYPIAEKLWRYGLYLPSGVGTTDEEISFSAESLRKAIKDFVK